MTGDRIVLAGVSATGFHGVLDAEKRDGQTFLVDVAIELDLESAGRTDDLARTLNYAEVAQRVVARIEEQPPFDLIERLAEVIADDVLADHRVNTVEVTVHKPQAPVGHPFTDVSVTVRRDNAPRVVIALGANLGDDPAATVRSAMAQLAGIRGMALTATSGLFATAPVGGPARQPDYVNAVAIGRYQGTPERLLQELHGIEARHGRTRGVRWSARTLDLDLIQFGVPGSRHERRYRDPDLYLPHPAAHERAFVLVPWLDADPAATLRMERREWDGGIAQVSDLLAITDASQVRAL